MQWLGPVLLVSVLALGMWFMFRAGKKGAELKETKRDLEAAKKIIDVQADSPSSLSDLKRELRDKTRKL